MDRLHLLETVVSIGILDIHMSNMVDVIFCIYSYQSFIFLRSSFLLQAEDCHAQRDWKGRSVADRLMMKNEIPL